MRISAVRARGEGGDGAGNSGGRGGKGGKGGGEPGARSATEPKETTATPPRRRPRRRKKHGAAADEEKEEQEEEEEEEGTEGGYSRAPRSARAWGPASSATQPLAPHSGDGGEDLADLLGEPEERGDLEALPEEEEEESFGSREAKGRGAPRGPTEKERAEHALTHLPYRSWCPACVAGRGLGPAHPTEKELLG